MLTEVDPYAPETVAVYRLYTHCGALLYVGISQDPKTRFKQHAAEKAWWNSVEFWTVRWYPDRTSAAAVEAYAIVHEVPAFNSSGVPSALMAEEVSTWRDAVRAGQPLTARQLNKLFVAQYRVATLPTGARTPWTADELTSIYNLARRHAGRFTRRRHTQFLDAREAQRVKINRDMQRRSIERARMTNTLARHAPALVSERPM